MRSRPISVFLKPLLLIALASTAGIAPARAQSVAFDFDAPIDLGSNLDRVGDLNRWSYVLGTDWNENFRIGGIIGKKNATVIPEVPNPLPFGPDPLVNKVTADTRTGARMTGNVRGDTGLEFFADYEASGLETGTAFQFRPEIVNMPAQVPAGEFFRLETVPGVVDNGAFSEELVDLPSFEAGMNFFFNLELDSTIDYGLFPVIPYGSTRFRPDPINVDQSLIKFQVDLDPDSNGGVGLPPSFVILEDTPFEDRIGLLDNSEYLAEKQFSVEVGVKDQPGVNRRLDIGSAHLVNPFGAGESILGPNERNLTITTDINATSVDYSFETPLLRLGLDLDGIAAYLAAGESFTRLEEEIKDSRDEDTLVSIKGDFIDIKYGPEIGFRETLSIEPDFEVTLSFDQNVGLKDGDDITFANTFSGQWSDLPEIALLGDENVEVSVSFDQVTGEQTKRSVFYISDYLELTLFELEELEVLESFKFSLPPVVQERVSLLGDLLGQIELELTDTTETISPFGVGTGLAGASSFTITPMPSTMVYLAGGTGEFSTDPAAWRELATHTAPATLDSAVLVIATGNGSEQVESDLQPTLLVDEGAGGFVQIDVAGLAIPAGSTFQQRGSRSWSLTGIVNDGLYQFDGNSIDFSSPVVLRIRGQGEMRFEGTSMAINAPFLSNEAGHTLTLRGDGGSIFVDQFENAGQITIDNSVITQIVADEQFSNSGGVTVTRGTDNRLTTPVLINNGPFEVDGGSTSLQVRHPEMFGQINIQSTTGNGQFIADDGATLHFTHTVLLDTPGVDEASPVQFNATGGGTIQFDNPIRAFDAGVAELNVDLDSTLILSGVEVQRLDAQVSLVNKGLVEVQAGANRLYFDPPRPVGDPNAPEPEIVGINIVNEGTIRIQPREGVTGPLFGFEAEIRNYVPGGATFSGGTWEIIGDVPAEPFRNDENPPFVLGQRTSELEILIKSVSNDDTFLGAIDFGDTDGDGVSDGYSAEDYDTELAVNDANVLLSGAARFDYFNTIRENRGQFTLRNRNHFDTDGDLLNSGEIRVEAEARLNVNGDLTIDEGSVFVDNSSILDVKANTIEVIGGNVTVERGAGPLFVNSPWIVREKWVGEDEAGEDVILEGRVSYGDAHFPTIGPDADILVEGERAVFEPLAGVNRIEGALTLAGGNELRLAQNLTNEGSLTLASAAKLYVDGDLSSTGSLEVDADSYLDVSGNVGVSSPSQPAAEGALFQLDGLLNTGTGNVDIGNGATLRGAGRLTGTLTTAGTLVADVTSIAADTDENQLLVDGQATLGGEFHVELSTDSLPAASAAISVVRATAGLDGTFENVASGGRLETLDGFGSFLVNYGETSSFAADEVVLSSFEPDPLLGDYNDSGAVEQGDLDLVLLNWGEPALPVPDGWENFLPRGLVDQAELDRVLLNWGTVGANVQASQAAVPEPAAGILAVILLVAAASSRRLGESRRLEAATT